MDSPTKMGFSLELGVCLPDNRPFDLVATSFPTDVSYFANFWRIYNQSSCDQPIDN